MIRNENDTNPENILVTFLTIQVDKCFRSGLKWPKKKYSGDGLGGNSQLQHFNVLL